VPAVKGASRTYTFEREKTINTFFENQRVATSVERSVRATFGGMPDIVCEELTDPDDNEPQWSITCLSEGVLDRLHDTLEHSLRANGVKVKNIASDGG
jgi:hypothetical protein